MNHSNPSDDLSRKYKEGNYYLTTEEKNAYLKVRMPATSAAIKKVFGLIFSKVNPNEINSYLDCGAGPGSSLLALNQLGVKLAKMVFYERDIELMSLGKGLFPEQANSYVQRDLHSLEPFENADLVSFCYSYNELDSNARKGALKRAFDATNQVLVVIEPGTPKGYKNILEVRAFLIEMGGYVLAPCPHNKPCPLQAPKWCHFSVRLERDEVHMQLKGADLPYEDEKFSYVVVSKKEYPTNFDRILHTPNKRKGMVEVELCTKNGVQKKIFTKSKNFNYKEIKKLNWGDEILNKY